MNMTLRIVETPASRTRAALGAPAACVGWLSLGLAVLNAAPTPPKWNLQTGPISKEIKSATSYAPVIKKVGPSVVNIFSSKKMQLPRGHPLLDDPFWRRFFGDEGLDPGRRPAQRMQQSLGSGVIVTSDGYILSNNHVVEGADEIKVILSQGEKEYQAKIVGSDPQTDVAVLKIEAKDLPAIPVTDSDTLEVGDTVLALGNPFGVGQTVTVGIVSGMGRGGFGVVDYEDFIQTDASINPGNSGGALVDAEGRLVGINTFILSRSGGSQGIGFAIPVNLARSVLDRIVMEGKVTRGYLGVYIQPITPELAKEFNLPDQTGALIGGVTPKSPAEEAGLKDGDVVIELNGKRVTDNRHLRVMVAQTAPKTKVTLKVLREGKEQLITATLGELPDDLAKVGSPGGPAAGKGALEGVELSDLDARSRQQFEIPSNLKGALITEVDEETAAQTAGLRAGDVILEINRQSVRNADDAVELARKSKEAKVLLKVWSKGGSRYVVVDASKNKR
jgi:serine protease Do